MSVQQQSVGHTSSRQSVSVGAELVPQIAALTALALLYDVFNHGVRNTFRLGKPWIAVGAISLLDAIWSPAIGFSLSGYTPFLIVMSVLFGATIILRWSGESPTLAIATEVVALWLAFASSGNILSYLSATVASPLQDNLLARADEALGFQWLVLYQWVWQHPAAGRLLSSCYRSLMPEMIVLGVWLSWNRREQRIREFFWVAYWASLVTGILAATLPAAGAFVHYGLLDKANWLHDLDALRSGTNLHFILPDMVGIDTFPSFHTVLALLAIYITRGAGVIGGLFVAWNMLMLISIPSIGSHYLVDMISGGVVLGICISLVRLIACRQQGIADNSGLLTEH